MPAGPQEVSAVEEGREDEVADLTVFGDEALEVVVRHDHHLGVFSDEAGGDGRLAGEHRDVAEERSCRGTADEHVAIDLPIEELDGAFLQDVEVGLEIAMLEEELAFLELPALGEAADLVELSVGEARIEPAVFERRQLSGPICLVGIERPAVLLVRHLGHRRFGKGDHASSYDGRCG